MYKLSISKRASSELAESYFFYEEQHVGLGDRFLVEVPNKIEQIKLFPKRYSSNRLPYREAMVRKFPFLIIYRYNSNKLHVLISSIFHASRNPKGKYI